MSLFRQLLANRHLGTLLLVAIVLRSLVATGYMLDTRPADGSLLSVMLCDGPLGSRKADHHDLHHHHSAATEHATHEHHEQAEQSHGFSACSFWSSSGQLLLLSFSIDHLFQAPLRADPVFQALVAHSPTYTRTPFPRAPPAYS